MASSGDDFVDWREEERKADAVNAALVDRGVWIVHDDGREYIGDFEAFDTDWLTSVLTLQRADHRVRAVLREYRGRGVLLHAADGVRLVEVRDARIVRVLAPGRPATNKRAGRGDAVLSCLGWKVIRGDRF